MVGVLIPLGSVLLKSSVGIINFTGYHGEESKTAARKTGRVHSELTGANEETLKYS